MAEVTMRLGKWSFEIQADDENLTFYAAHESGTPPVEIPGEPSCEPMEWAVRITVDHDWAEK